MRTLACLLALTALAAAQDVVLRDAGGRELVSVAGMSLGGGLTVVERGSLRGAATAEVRCQAAQRALIVGEDRDAGLALLWSPCNSAPVAGDGLLAPGQKVHTELHETRVVKAVDSASFGFIYWLHTEKRHPRAGALLLGEDDQPAGWYVTRVVTGQMMSFALPLERLRSLTRRELLTLGEWNAGFREQFEDAYQRAMAYLWIEDFEDAEYYLGRAVELAPRDARAWFHLAFAQGKNGRAAQREASYRKALALDPDLAEAHYNLAIVLVMTSKGGEADAHLTELYRLQSPLAEKLAGFLEFVRSEPPGQH